MLLLIKIGFVNVTIWDVLDILIVGLLLFQIFKLLRGSLGFNVFIGLVLVYFTWRLVSLLEMPLLSSILGQFVSIGMIALLILFQPEVRKFLMYVGKESIEPRMKFFGKLIHSESKLDQFSLIREKCIRELIRAMEQMSASRTGGLILISDSINIDGLFSSGVALNAEISTQLILSIFNRDSPLHDGAIIIHNDKILYASCVLPLTENESVPQRLGLRHRAAIGLSELSNVLAFIISEETGEISYTRNGQLHENITGDNIHKLLVRKLFSA